MSLAVCFHNFELWKGQPISDTYGGKALLDCHGEPLFAELAILRLIQTQGWQGVWIDTYSKRFRQFLPPHACDLPQHAQRFLDRANGGQKWRSGCPDVLAWSEGQYLFVEVKRKRRDKILKSQRRWLDEAIHAGIPAECFLVFEWETAPLSAI